MRLDKYLKVSRLIKRRTIAKEACENDRVLINNKISKPSSEIKEGDTIEIRFANSILKAKVTSIKETTKKDESKYMYEIIEGKDDL